MENMEQRKTEQNMKAQQTLIIQGNPHGSEDFRERIGAAGTRMPEAGRDGEAENAAPLHKIAGFA